jgi:hypothetical protein
MILDHVAQSAGPFVVRGTPLDAHGFSSSDLHVIDVAAVPNRLEHAVAEPEHHQVLNGFFSEIVVDAKNLILVEVVVELDVELARAAQVCAERFLDDDPAPCGLIGFGESSLTQPVDDGAVDRWRNREVVEHAVGPVELLEPRLQTFVQSRIALLA